MCAVDAYDIIHPSGTENANSGSDRPFMNTLSTDEI